MNKLKPCPFCGKMPEVYEFNRRKYYGCGRDECYTAGFNGTVTKSIWNTRPIEDALNARIAELSQAVGLITTLKPTMVMDADHPLEMAKEVAEYVTARIAELEERLELCESALVSMTYQFFYSSESGALAHSFMSAEEEAAEYLVDYGIARWENEHRNSIVFEEESENGTRKRP